MRVIIMGCGRVGGALAAALDDEHDVVVVDREPTAFDRLPRGFRGRTVTGIGFDRSVLADCGTDHADAFAAVSSGDNSNIIAARVARESFGVDRVVARIYDSGRAEVYERLGIPTVATVPWATDRLLRHLTGDPGPAEWRDRTGAVSLVPLPAPTEWVGATADEFAAAVDGRAVAVTRFGHCRLVDPQTLIQADDVLHLAMASDALDRLTAATEAGPTDG